MSRQLNITNGDCAVNIMRQAKIKGDYLPWRDVLHDGPVRAGLSLEELSKERAKFISDSGWGNAQNIAQSFIDRDQSLSTYQQYDKVVLWFEHDLYDQLQILQILDWFYAQNSIATTLSMICTDHYLGQLNADEMKALYQFETVVSKDQLTLANKAWQAFCADTPQRWFDLLDTDLSALPFLEGSIIRLLEEYPNCSNGLYRTVTQALECIKDEEKSLIDVFINNQEQEERVYLGDSSFAKILNELIQATPPLIKLKGSNIVTTPFKKIHSLKITNFGCDVLAGKSHFLDAIELNRWLGGVQLSNTNIWCWYDNKIIKMKRDI